MIPGKLNISILGVQIFVLITCVELPVGYIDSFFLSGTGTSLW